MKIAVDVGHANNTGAKGWGLEEHALAQGIATKLLDILKEKYPTSEIIDFPTHSNREDLNLTIQTANEGSFDLGVSIHCDCSNNTDARGAHVCYYSSEGRSLAKCIAPLVSNLRPGRAETYVRRTDLAVLKQTRPLWVLVECGFISNEGDAQFMRNNPGAVALAIANGIFNYINSK